LKWSNIAAAMRTRPLFFALSLAILAACGHSEDEWQAQLKKYQELSDKDAAIQKDLEGAKAKVADLEKALRDAGVDIQEKAQQMSKLSSTVEEQAKALAEYKARAAKLEAIRARFELLRKKLDELTRIGLEVKIRHNRMVISLPGDVLFDSGKDSLKKEGEDILKKVAAVIHNDKGLNDRDYQVAGHTDNQPLQGGVFHDNWGLSLMRARGVLLYMIGKNGNLPQHHWSAAGFADTDPVANNGTKDGQQKNRRCDLVVVPDVDEMIDLKTLAQ
jgi:chemotaxis protein MotB